MSSLLDILHRRDSNPDRDPAETESATEATDNATDNVADAEPMELRLAVDNGPPGSMAEATPAAATTTFDDTKTFQHTAMFGATGIAAPDGRAPFSERAASLGVPGEAAGQLTAEKLRQRSRQNTMWLAAGLTLIIMAAGAATWLLNEVGTDTAGEDSLFVAPVESPGLLPVITEGTIERPAAVANSSTTGDRPASATKPAPKPATRPAVAPPPATSTASTATDDKESDWFDVPALEELRDAGNALVGEPIRIVRGTTTNPLFPKITEAWAAFQLADYARAETLYREVLAADATSVDALLGLGAIAARGNRTDEARSLYEAALLVDPRNATANSALSSLPAGGNLRLDESSLKTLLRDQPGAANLHFALGLQYVAQGRWPDAQNAFFEAVKNEPTNADYAYNLAVSLDRLGQTGPAAAYYQRALDLATASALFNPTVAQDRLATLRAAAD